MDIIPKKKESDFRDLPLYKVRIDYKNQGYVNCHKMEPIPIKDFWMYLKKYNIKEYNKSKTNESLYK